MVLSSEAEKNFRCSVGCLLILPLLLLLSSSPPLLPPPPQPPSSPPPPKATTDSTAWHAMHSHTCTNACMIGRMQRTPRRVNAHILRACVRNAESHQSQHLPCLILPQLLPVSVCPTNSTNFKSRSIFHCWTPLLSLLLLAPCVRWLNEQ